MFFAHINAMQLACGNECMEMLYSLLVVLS